MYKVGKCIKYYTFLVPFITFVESLLILYVRDQLLSTPPSIERFDISPFADPIILQAAGSAHSLTLLQEHWHLELEMLIVKKAIQPIKLTETGITAEMIQTAWTQQGSDWFELYHHVDGPIFTATRVIWLPKGCLEWNLLHVDGHSFDTLGFTSLTRELWEKIKSS